MNEHEHEHTKTKTETKQPKTSKQSKIQKVLLIVLYVLTLGIFTASLIHFTNLRNGSPVDPIGIMKTKINQPKERQENINQANHHIGEAERLSDWLKQQDAGNKQDQQHGGNAHAKTYNEMLAHNDKATSYMLAAESQGVDLKKEGLIKRLCDSLRAQYLLITGKDASTIKDSETLNARVSHGEDLQTVYNQIKEQLEFAMSW